MENPMRRVSYLSVLLPLLAMSLWAQEEKNQKPVVFNPAANMKHFVILFAVVILLFLSFFTTICMADLYPQTIFGVRPTVEQFKAEIVRADLVIQPG